MATIETERQALVALAKLFQDLTQDSDTILAFFDALESAVAVLAAGVVQSDAPRYQPGAIAAVSLTPTGQLRVASDELAVDRIAASPWDGADPWEGVL